MNEGMLKETHILFLERWAINDSQRNEQFTIYSRGHLRCIQVDRGPGLELEYLGARPLRALGSPSLCFFGCKNETLPTSKSYLRSTQFFLALGLGSLLSREPQLPSVLGSTA